MVSEWINAIGFGFIGSILLWLVKKIMVLGSNQAVILDFIKRNDKESILSQRRHNVTDRIVSKITDRDYDSRKVSEGGEYPEIHKNLQRILIGIKDD